MKSDNINREAHKSKKGYRLQKLRALLLLLNAVEENENALCYSLTEYREDVHFSEPGTLFYEEDKYFDEETKFSFNHNKVRNTMVSFLDIWIDKNYSKKLYLGFYTNVDYTGERLPDNLKNEGIALPDKPILSLLQEKPLNFEYPNLLSCMKAIVIEEYKNQYSKHKNQNKIKNIERLSNKDWEEFFSCIKWKFSAADKNVLENEILLKIKNSRFFNSNNIGKETILMGYLLDIIEQREGNEDFADRIITGSDIRLAFKEIETQSLSQKEDPLHKMWTNVETNDKRNLIDKLKTACSDFNQHHEKHYAMIVTRNQVDAQFKWADNKNFRAAEYRIYERCNEIMIGRLMNREREMTYNQLMKEIMDILYEEGIACAKQFQQNLQDLQLSDSDIKGIILSLFENCFLYFDE